MTDLTQRYHAYLVELETLRKKTDGRPLPEVKKRRCESRRHDLEERLIPSLMAEMQHQPEPHAA